MRTLFSNFLEEKISACTAEDQMFILHQQQGRHAGEHIQVLFVWHEKTDVSWTDTHLTVHIQKSFDRLAKDYAKNSKSGIWIRQGRTKIDRAHRDATSQIADVVSLEDALKELPDLINDEDVIQDYTADWLGSPDLVGARHISQTLAHCLKEKTKWKFWTEDRTGYVWPDQVTLPRIQWKDSILPRPKEVGYW